MDRPEIEKQLKRILTGDQITLRGKLVNVTARLVGEGGRYDSASITWNTSTTRTDTGAGACEVIYVEDVQILRPAHPLARRLFHASLCGPGRARALDGGGFLPGLTPRASRFQPGLPAAPPGDLGDLRVRASGRG